MLLYINTKVLARSRFARKNSEEPGGLRNLRNLRDLRDLRNLAESLATKGCSSLLRSRQCTRKGCRKGCSSLLRSRQCARKGCSSLLRRRRCALNGHSGLSGAASCSSLLFKITIRKCCTRLTLCSAPLCSALLAPCMYMHGSTLVYHIYIWKFLVCWRSRFALQNERAA